MKKILLIFLISFFSLIVYSQEVLTEFSEETLPVLNEELRSISSDIDELVLGSWTSKSNNKSYEAETDGFVCALGAAAGTPAGYTDSSNPPTTQRGGGGTVSMWMGFPVRKGDYWKTETCTTVYWIPWGN